jgi:hypothetical protein
MMTCAATIREHLPSWNVVVATQEYTSVEDQRLRKALPDAMIVSMTRRVGMHSAKMAALRHVRRVCGSDPYVVCSIDDDMEFLPQTNLEPCVAKSLDPMTGFVTANWVAHPNHLAKRKIRHAFVKQPIVYTAGGMVFDRKVADIISALPDARYYSDNSKWSIAAYTAGLSNYRYLGSLAIHRICQKGGRRAWVIDNDVVPPDPEMISVREGRPIAGKTEYLIGRSEDLTDHAHNLHKMNAALRRQGTA